ncbi:MAG: serine/threonine-protein kinase [Halanaerobacter sp.]
MVIESPKVDYVYLPQGTILNNKYLIKNKLAPKSNLSIVYLAINSKTKEQVVVKEFFPQELALRDLNGRSVVSKRPGGDILKKEIERFLREAKIMKELRDYSVGRCYNYFKENNTAYIIFKYYQGPNLEEYITQKDLILEEFLKQIFYPLLKTVAFIHQQGYIHRDLKPSNIIYASKPILIDFGSAIRYKEESTKRRVLTPGYSPLEFYAQEAKQNPSSDIYSLAAILYYYLTSKIPVAANERVIDDSLIPVNELNSAVAQGLNDLIMRNLCSNIEYRDQTIEKFRLNLELECFKIKSKKIINSFFSNFFL